MQRVGERKNDGFGRIGIVVMFSVLWGLFGTGGSGIFGELIINFILLFCAEFSFEYYNKHLCIRAAGNRWVLDGWLRFIIWPFAKPLDMLGVKNCPILAFLMTGFFLYAMVRGTQVLDTMVHIVLLWVLYFNRKAEK